MEAEVRSEKEGFPRKPLLTAMAQVQSPLQDALSLLG